MDRNEKKIALNKKISDFTDDLKEKAGGLKNLGRDALVVGGILVAGYALMRVFNSGNEEDVEETQASDKDSIFFSAAKGLATTVLLAIAKAKLTEYLDSLTAEEDDEQDS